MITTKTSVSTIPVPAQLHYIQHFHMGRFERIFQCHGSLTGFASVCRAEADMSGLTLRGASRQCTNETMEQARFANSVRATRHMFIRDLVVNASIGVHAHEKDATQRVRINLDLAVADEVEGAKLSRPAVGRDDLARVVDYEAIINRVRAMVVARHVQLIETLAERLAEACLHDPRIRVIRVRIEKLDVFADAASVGVEVERRNC